ncbi:MAG: hypothetical protein GY738_26525 [Pseudoalteromonas sp.]|nr:hypothetical protein [Pseudoalteromonas sp.]
MTDKTLSSILGTGGFRQTEAPTSEDAVTVPTGNIWTTVLSLAVPTVLASLKLQSNSTNNTISIRVTRNGGTPFEVTESGVNSGVWVEAIVSGYPLICEDSVLVEMKATGSNQSTLTYAIGAIE